MLQLLGSPELKKSRYILKKQAKTNLLKKNPIEKSHPTKRQTSIHPTHIHKILIFPPFLLQIISFSSRLSKTLEEQGSQVPLLLERKPSKHLLHPKAPGSRPPAVVVVGRGVKLPNPTPLVRKLGGVT